MKIQSIDLINYASPKLIIYFENGEYPIYIDIENLEGWLRDNGYMDNFYFTAGHHGEPVEHDINFEDYEEWAADKTYSDQEPFLIEFLKEQMK